MTVTFFAMSGLINCIVALGSGIVVLVYNWRGKINRIYFLLGMAMAFWSFGYWMWLNSSNADSALFWVRIMALGTIGIPVTYFHVLTEILQIKKNFIIAASYIVLAIVALMSPLNIFISGITPKLFFPYWPVPGPLYNFVVLGLYAPIVFYSFYLIIKFYRSSEGLRRTQLFFLLLGSVLGWVGGLSNYFLWYNVPIPPYGNFFVAAYTLFIGYAILKNRLFQTKIIAAEIFTFLIWIFLALKTNFSANYQDFLVNASILAGTVVVGFLLIQSVMAEIKYREKIIKAYKVEKKAKEDLAELDKVKNQFIMTTQHHLRTPLGAIRGYASSILDGTYGNLPQKFVEPVKRVKVSSERLLSISDEFLAISQLQIGKDIVFLKPGINISSILESIVEEETFEAERKGLYLNFNSGEEEKQITISADTNMLRSALLNFVDNAVKYTEKGGVNVTLSRAENMIRIAIKDTGIGMSGEEFKTNFSKLFERGEEAKKMNVLGRGIGVYLSHKIITEHKGIVRAESGGKNLGTTIIVEIPIT